MFVCACVLTEEGKKQIMTHSALLPQIEALAARVLNGWRNLFSDNIFLIGSRTDRFTWIKTHYNVCVSLPTPLCDLRHLFTNAY